MKQQIRYLFFLLLIFSACAEGDKEKRLFPSKIVIGSTTHEFHYDASRIYSVTTSRPNFYEEVSYRYYDEYFNEPDHMFKNEIFEVWYKPDAGPIGWDSSDSIKSRQEMLSRLSVSDLVTDESQSVFLSSSVQQQKVKHRYNKDQKLVESTFFFYEYVEGRKNIQNDIRYISKQVKYVYVDGKLAKAKFYAAGSQTPYLLIELAYDDNPGYLSQLPLEARFLPLDLPYRDHNITGYFIIDRYGKVRKDLSYKCEYTYNEDGYPTEFTRKMLDGTKTKGYILYETDMEKDKG